MDRLRRWLASNQPSTVIQSVQGHPESHAHGDDANRNDDLPDCRLRVSVLPIQGHVAVPRRLNRDGASSTPVGIRGFSRLSVVVEVVVRGDGVQPFLGASVSDSTGSAASVLLCPR
jgi:hypothetical protein